MASAAPQPAGGTSLTSLDQLLSYNVRSQPRAVFTRLAMGGDRATEGELGCFEMPLIHGAKLQLGRFDPETDGPGRKDKFVLSMADRRGLSRSHGWLECHEGRFLVVWPVTEKEGFPTWVNGKPIKSSTSLRTGDWVGFGAMNGKPVVEFDCTIVNTSPQKPKVNSPRVRSDDHRWLEGLCCGRLRLVNAVQTQQQPPEWTLGALRRLSGHLVP